MTGKPDPKPRRRLKLTRLRLNQLAASVVLEANRTGGCECGCGRQAQTAHHVVRRGWGDDVRANLIGLNGHGTAGCHGAITAKQRMWDAERGVYIEPAVVLAGIRRRMQTVRVDVLAYVLEHRGEDWLDAQYPARPGSRHSAR